MQLSKEHIIQTDPLWINYENLILKEVDYDSVKIYKSRAAKERVSISETNNTLWFEIIKMGYEEHEHMGCCGLYLAKNKCRIKGDWIKPEYRGQGYGEFITQSRLLIAEHLNYDLIEVLTLHPHYYRKKNFTIHKEIRSGVWLSDLAI